jgi:hypothetical protein
LPDSNIYSKGCAESVEKFFPQSWCGEDVEREDVEREDVRREDT